MCVRVRAEQFKDLYTDVLSLKEESNDKTYRCYAAAVSDTIIIRIATEVKEATPSVEEETETGLL